jgi:hypothetical protein
MATRKQTVGARSLFEPKDEPPRLPDGPYEVIGIPREQLRGGDHRLERGHETWIETRSGAALSRQQDLRERADRSNLELFVRPVQPPDATSIAFRGATRAQVEALAQAGLGPTWLVRVGADRFDLTVRFAVRLTEVEERAMRQQIADRFGLTKPEGAFLNAFHLPQPRPDQLLRSSEEAAPRAAALLDLHRQRLARDEVEHLAQRLAAPLSLPKGAGTLVSALHTPELGRPVDRFENLQERVEAIRRGIRGSATSHSQPFDGALAERARHLQQALGQAPVLKPSHVAALLAAEEELARQHSSARLAYLAALALREVSVQKLEGATKTVQARAATPASFETYRGALVEYQQAEQRLVDAAEHYAGARAAQLGLDRLRAAATLAWVPTEAAHQRLFDLTVLELKALRLAARGSATPRDLPGSVDEVQRQIEQWDARLTEARAALRTGGSFDGALVATWIEHRVEAQTQLYAASLAEHAEPPALLLSPGASPQGNAWIETYLRRRESQAWTSFLQTSVTSLGFLQRESLDQALERLLQHGPSPEILRQSYRLVSLHRDLDPTPEQRGARALSASGAVERLWVLTQGLRDSARAVLDAGAKTPEPLWRRLHHQLGEVQALARGLDRHERSLLLLPEPPSTSSHHPWAARATAWAFYALERRFPAHLVASHLGNLSPSASVGSTFRAGGRDFEITTLARKPEIALELSLPAGPQRLIP